MECNFNINTLGSECASVSGVKAVSVLCEEGSIVSANSLTKKIETITPGNSNQWGKIDLINGKGSIALATTIDSKKNLFMNAYTLVFNNNKFNAQIVENPQFLTEKVLVAVLLNDGTAWLMGENGQEGDFNDCHFTAIASNTGAAMGDAHSTDYTVLYKTTGYMAEIDMAQPGMADLFNVNGNVIIEEVGA